MAKDGSLGLSGFALLALYAQCAYAQSSAGSSTAIRRTTKSRVRRDRYPLHAHERRDHGEVIVFAGGSLVANDISIKGNLYTSRADFIAMERSQIDGNVRLEELVGDETTIEGTNIDGDILLARNRSRLEIVNNDIHGGMFAIGNTGGLLISVTPSRKFSTARATRPLRSDSPTASMSGREGNAPTCNPRARRRSRRHRPQ